MVLQAPPLVEFASPAEARAAALERWAHLDRGGGSSLTDIRNAHAEIKEGAEQLSGTTREARRRGVIYFSIYEDSEGNFMFPLIASHGSLWGVTHTVRLEQMLSSIRPLSRHGRIDKWLEALDAVRDVNRRVFVEIYTTFYFTRYFGRHREAANLIKPEVLALYNRIHAAVERGELLSLSERRSIYYDVFVHEQHDIVDPGVHDAAEMAGSTLLLELTRRVTPRFRYFPPGERLYFTDFMSIDQRNREGLRAMDFAEQVTAARVLEAMGEYGL